MIAAVSHYRENRKDDFVMTVSTDEPAVSLQAIYRLVSVLWAIYALALAMAIYGSTLLSYAEPGRIIVAVLAACTCLGMVVRTVFPGRPRWTRWTLPVIGTVGVCSFVLAQFGIEFAGGMTFARAGYSLLLLTPALIAYVHWIAERIVVRT